MKSLSLQQSLLQEILALEQILQGSSKNPKPQKNRGKFQDFFSKAYNHKNKEKQRQVTSRSPVEYFHHDINTNEMLPLQIESKITIIQNEDKSPKNYPAKRSKRIKTQYDNQKKQSSTASVTASATARKRNNDSYYQKNMRHMNCKKSIISLQKEQQQQKQLEECSHQPYINPVSRNIIDQIEKKQLLDKIHKKHQESKQRWINSAKQKQLEECSFTPNLSKELKHRHTDKRSSDMRRSVALSQQSSINAVNVSVFDALYEDSKSRAIKLKEKEEQYVNNCVTNPKIDQLSKYITAKSSFEQRLAYYEHKKIQKQYEKKKKQEKQNMNLHKPQINPTSKRRLSQVPVGQRLYQKSKKPQIAIQQPKKKSVVNQKSSKVYQQRKVLVFYQIFKLLDSDEDGVISIDKMNLDSLPLEIIQIIYPLIEQLDNLQVQLQQHQFVSSLFNLFKTLTIHEKSLLLGLGSKKNQLPQPLFQPKINRKSQQIASEIQRSDYSIYDYCSIKMAEKQRQLETERIEKNEKQIKQCTFQPKLTKNYRY